jgi:hypothetical protein
MKELHTIQVLKIPIYAGPLSSAADMIIERCRENNEKNNLHISATGAHGLVTDYNKFQHKGNQ